MFKGENDRWNRKKFSDHEKKELMDDAETTLSGSALQIPSTFAYDTKSSIN